MCSHKNCAVKPYVISHVCTYEELVFNCITLAAVNKMLASLLHAAGTRLVAIVIGSVIGLVFLILSVILGIHIVRTVRKHREPTPSPNDGDVVLPKYGTPHPINRMLWQGRGNSMQMPRETPLQDAIDEQRLNVISKAMGHFSNIVSNRVVRFS